MSSRYSNPVRLCARRGFSAESFLLGSVVAVLVLAAGYAYYRMEVRGDSLREVAPFLFAASETGSADSGQAEVSGSKDSGEAQGGSNPEPARNGQTLFGRRGGRP